MFAIKMKAKDAQELCIQYAQHLHRIRLVSQIKEYNEWLESQKPGFFSRLFRRNRPAPPAPLDETTVLATLPKEWLGDLNVLPPDLRAFWKEHPTRVGDTEEVPIAHFYYALFLVEPDTVIEIPSIEVARRLGHFVHHERKNDVK